MNPHPIEAPPRRLSSRDYDQLLRCASALHSFKDAASLRLWLLDEALPRLVPSDWFSYNEVDLRNPGNTLTLMRPAIAPTDVPLARFAELAHQHPLIVRQLHHRDLSVRKISDLVRRRDYHRLDLYHDVYRLLGVEYQIAAALESRSDFIVAFALSRRTRDYSERDRAMLQHIRDQLLVALRNVRAAEEAEIAMADAARALECGDLATLMVDEHGGVLRFQGPALEWLGAELHDPLPQNVLAWLRRRMTSPHNLPCDDLPLIVRGPDGEISIRAVPSAKPGETLLVAKLKSVRSGIESLAALGLSRREREVACWVGEGKSNAQIAAILGISPRTVQKHIENIFARLNVESRLGIALLVFGK